MTAATGFTALYRRRLSVSLSQPAALAGQVLTPVLWVLVVGPALTRAFGGFTHQVNYTSYVSLGQVVFILPFSAMFAGLTTMFDRDWGIMRELLVAPIHRAVIPLASTAVVLTVAAGQFAIIVGLALARGAHFATTPARLLTALAAAALLSAGVYGLAEFLVYTIKKPQAFGTLIPAIGATPVCPVRRHLPDRSSPPRRQVAQLGPSLDAQRLAAAVRPDGRHRSRPAPDLAN